MSGECTRHDDTFDIGQGALGKPLTRRELLVKGSVFGLSATAFGSLLMACGGSDSSTASSGQKTYKVYNALSYSGNAWADSAANMIQALASTPPYDKQVEFKRIISGNDISKHISDLQSMIDAGADAIIMYPLSPTAYNALMQKADAAGCKIFCYDGTICNASAYNISYITSGVGQNTMQFIVNQIGGKGKIFMNGGVSGTATDKIQCDSAKKVLESYPEVEVVAEYWSNWDPVQSKTNTMKALASNPEVNAIWSQDGEYGVVQALESTNHAMIPVSGNQANGFMWQMDEHGGAGLHGVAAGSPPIVGAYAFKLAMELLTGSLSEDQVPHNVQFMHPWAPYDQLKLGDPTDVSSGNYFPLDVVPAVYFVGIDYPNLVPEVDFNSAMKGTVKPGAKIQPINPADIEKAPDVPGINTTSTEMPAGIYDVNTDIVTPIAPPS